MSVIRRLWSFYGICLRTEYAAVGFMGMLIKYLMDLSVIYAVTQKIWAPASFLSPFFMAKAGLPRSVQLYLFIAMLPFAWLSLAMSVKRIRSTQLNILWTISLFIPILNYIFMLILCLIPEGVALPANKSPPLSKLMSTISDSRAWLGIVAAAILGCIGLLFFTNQMKMYGNSLFLILPFIMGVLWGFCFGKSPIFSRAGLLFGSIAIWMTMGVITLLFALEGIICLLMVSPIAILMILFGSLVGSELAQKTKFQAIHLSPLLALNFFMAAIEKTNSDLPLKKISTSVVIHASIEKVWQNVIKFPSLPDPSTFIKYSGIAYPIRARIEGEGVGAIRSCEFSTGAFVEPITAWEYPHRLAFSVSNSPPTMKEWNPFHDISPSHLNGYFMSRQGEFLLAALGETETLVTGSTWYTLDIHPTFYWGLWADWIVHGIHNRVLGHIKSISEENH